MKEEDGAISKRNEGRLKYGKESYVVSNMERSPMRCDMLRQGLSGKHTMERGTFFWRNVWLGNKPIYKRVKELMDQIESEAKVVHFWENGGRMEVGDAAT